MSDVRLDTECRICGSGDLHEVLDFGELALTGVFPAFDEEVPTGRVRLVLCPDCGLVQLGDTFPPEEMVVASAPRENGSHPF